MTRHREETHTKGLRLTELQHRGEFGHGAHLKSPQPEHHESVAKPDRTRVASFTWEAPPQEHSAPWSRRRKPIPGDHGRGDLFVTGPHRANRSPMELPRSASRQELALLRFPDRRTDWVVILIATLERSLDVAELTRRISSLHLAIPMVGARLRHEVWHPGEPSDPVIIEGEHRRSPLDAAFDLAMEPPVRLVLGSNGRRLAVACHHAAFDGRARSRSWPLCSADHFPHR